jgi:hypothetical protein
MGLRQVNQVTHISAIAYNLKMHLKSNQKGLKNEAVGLSCIYKNAAIWFNFFL